MFGTTDQPGSADKPGSADSADQPGQGGSADRGERQAENLARIESDPVLERYLMDEYDGARELGQDHDAAIAYAVAATVAWDKNGQPR